jgi:two-component system chemotaxis response regulator CheB
MVGYGNPSTRHVNGYPDRLIDYPRCAQAMSVKINSEEVVRDVVVIGASAGGLAAVAQLLSKLPRDLPAAVGVVIHRGASTNINWSEVLGRDAKICVLQPANGSALRRSVVYVAQADHHMRFRGGLVVLDRDAKQQHTRPAVNPLFTSAANEYGIRVLGILLSGGGFDGTEGLKSITDAGGIALVQSISEAEHKSMPEHALRHAHVSAALPIDHLALAITALAHGRMFRPQNM